MQRIKKHFSQLVHTKFWKRPRQHPYVSGAFLSIFLFFMACFGLVVVNAQTVGPDDIKIVDVYEDGELRSVPTRKATVAEFLDEQNIEISQVDLVEPSTENQIDSESFEVKIFRAKPVSIHENGQTKRFLSAYQEPRMIAENAGYKLNKADLVEFEAPGIDIALAIIIKRAQVYKINLYGEIFEHRSHLTSVKDVLLEAGIILQEGDSIVPNLDEAVAPNGLITISRFGTEVITVEEDIPFGIERRQDSNLSVTYREIIKAGVKGKKIVTYEVLYVNDIEASRTVVREYVESEPEVQIEVVGTLSNYSGSLQEWLAALRQCEAGGAYDRNSGNGFYGAYQFLISTWNRIAPKAGRPDLVGVRPDLASPNDQDMMIIANTKLSNGGLATQNPGCYRKLGLSQFPPE